MKILTAENYYEPDEYMSVSAFKEFKRCELSALSGEFKTTEAMLIGSYVDAYIEGTLEQFKNDHPEIFLSRGSNKGELKEAYKKAQEICEFITNDRVFSQFMSGKKQQIFTGQINGVPFKIKIDSYSEHIAINDLKVMATVTDQNGNYKDFITPWGYDIQLACYQEIVRQNTGERLLAYICAATKEDPIDSIIINIPQSFLDRALCLVEGDIQHYYDVKMGRIAPVGCGHCAYCRSLRKETKIISLHDIIQM